MSEAGKKSPKYKTIIVPTHVWLRLLQLKGEITRRGTDSFPRGIVSPEEPNITAGTVVEMGISALEIAMNRSGTKKKGTK